MKKRGNVHNRVDHNAKEEQKRIRVHLYSMHFETKDCGCGPELDRCPLLGVLGIASNELVEASRVEASDAFKKGG